MTTPGYGPAVAAGGRKMKPLSVAPSVAGKLIRSTRPRLAAVQRSIVRYGSVVVPPGTSWPSERCGCAGSEAIARVCAAKMPGVSLQNVEPKDGLEYSSAIRSVAQYWLA